MSPRRLLVTGGSGHLGGELARRAGDAGWAVTATAFRGVADVRVDVRDAQAVEAMVVRTRPDCVIHTAYVQSGPDAWSTNAGGSAHVAAAAATAGARLIHMSTDLVFDGRAGRPYREDDPIGPVIEYGRTKADAERRVADAHPAATIVRTSLIYGGPAPSVQERRILEIADGTADVALFTDELRCPVHVADLAEAVLALAGLEAPGPLHLAGADGVSRHEFACLVAAAHGRDPGRLRTTTAAETAPERPRDCRLDCARAAALLGGPLRGVREVLGGEG